MLEEGLSYAVFPPETGEAVTYLVKGTLNQDEWGPGRAIPLELEFAVPGKSKKFFYFFFFVVFVVMIICYWMVAFVVFKAISADIKSNCC